ncbi:PHB depolymerase family esterase [Duganella sp. LX47W]|uniref:PHB depolymerase family esterase n=2 Tax=Rugamonas apoptosis TaxID=2758570 RepID=A0A7W2F786_9BURK|nr:PHB depolymerase family esterase [Rugamonas apoptosis]
MVKRAAGLRFLRGLVRSGMAQQRAVGKVVAQLLAGPTAKPKSTAKSTAKSTVRPARKTAAAPASLPAKVAAPHVPASPGKWLASHYTAPALGGVGAARRMSYWLYLPEQAPDPASAGLPLVVLLHGCQQTATQLAQGTRMNQLAERSGCAVLYPQQRVSSHAQRCWKWFDHATQLGGGDVPMIVGIIDKVQRQYGLDRSRIYIAGMSAGAGMAHIVALNHPDLIAAVGLHSGPAFGAGHSVMGALGVLQHGAGARGEHAIRDLLQRRPPFPGMPTILIQGEVDRVVRPINQRQLLEQGLLLNGLPAGMAAKVSSVPGGRAGSRKAHQIQDYYVGRTLLLRVARIAQLEHAWSGGDPAVPFHASGGPDAGQMMLDFFARHRRAPA